MLVDVPEDSAAVREETFGPTLTITKVATAEEGVALDQRQPVRPGRLGLRQGARGRRWPGGMRSGMVSINGTLTFAGFPSLPFGGVGDSGFGRIHGDDGLREFTRPKAITRRRMASAVPSTTYARKPRHLRIVEQMVRLHPLPRLTRRSWSNRRDDVPTPTRP